MCTFPNRLKSPSKHFDPLKDRLYVTCNCGHCVECMDAKRTDWQTRLYYDWLRAMNEGGNAFICTLTYDNDHLPVKYLWYKDKYVAFPCFESRDIQELTHDIRRKHKDFMYFAQEEYGDSGRPYITDSGKLAYTTHRPHYHLYCSCSSLSVDELKSLVEELWVYGNVYWSKRKDSLLPPGVIDGAGAIGYASKYVCKDMASDKSLQLALSLLPEDVSEEDKKVFIPRHFQSKGLGMFVTEVTPLDMLAAGYCEVPDPKVGKRVVKLPLYVDRKLFYTSDNPTHTYIPTEEGREMLALRASNIRMKSIEDMRELVNHPDEHISDELLYEINDILNQKFKTPLEYIQKFLSLKGKYSITQLVDYGILFKDQIVENSKNGHYSYLGNLSSYLLYDISLEEFRYLYADKLDKNRNSDFCPSADDREFDLLKHELIQVKSPEYARMEAALTFINAYSQACSIISWHEKIKRRDEYKRLSKYYKSKNYDYKRKIPRAS